MGDEVAICDLKENARLSLWTPGDHKQVLLLLRSGDGILDHLDNEALP